MAIRTQTVRFNTERTPMPKRIKLGFESDNLVERLEFVLPEIAAQQNAALLIGGRLANAVLLDRSTDGRWGIDLTAEIVGDEGAADAYVRIDTADGRIWNSGVLTLTTLELPDVDTEIEQRFPTAVEQMLSEMAAHEARMDEQETAIKEAAQTASEAAAATEGVPEAAADAKVSAESAAKSAKSAQTVANGLYGSVFSAAMNPEWSAGGIQSADGSINALKTRIRTDYIENPYLYIRCSGDAEVSAAFYSAPNKSGYLSMSDWITCAVLSDLMPIGATHVRLIARHANASGSAVPDVDALGANVAVSTLPGMLNDVYGVYVPDVPENVGMLNAVLNFKQLAEIAYTPIVALPAGTVDGDHSGHFKAGVTVNGLPYSSERQNAGFVPNFVSFHTYMTALKNPNSYLYTVDTNEQYGNKNGHTYYGTVCSVSCAYALNIVPNYTTHQWGEIDGMEPLEWQSVYALKLGDTICTKSESGGHVVMVTDITRNKRGRIGTITISEAAAPRVKHTEYTPEALETKYPYKDWTYYRYSKIHTVQHIQSPYVAVEDEVPQSVTYNTVLIPRKGDKANWRTDETVEIDVLDKGTYTRAEVYKDGELYKTIEPCPDCVVLTGDAMHTVHGLLWARGGITGSTGEENADNNRIKSGWISSVGLHIAASDEMEVNVFFYTADQTYISASEFISAPVDVAAIAPDGAAMCRITARYTDDQVIETTAVDEVGAQIAVSTAAAEMPVPMVLGGLLSADGSENVTAYRTRSGMIPVNGQVISIDSTAQYYVYYYDTDGGYISNGGAWLSDETTISDAAPDGAEFFRLVLKDTSNASKNLTDLVGAYAAMVHVAVGDNAGNAGSLPVGNYEVRLANDSEHSASCSLIVTDAWARFEATGNAGEVKVTFGATNAAPLFIAWCNSSNLGTVHISVPTADELAAGSAVCAYKSGAYKVRMAFKTLYGVVHTMLAEVSV